MELQVNGKFVPSSKVKIFQNPFCNILEIINRNYHNNYFFGYHDALEIYGALKQGLLSLTKVMYCDVVK